MSDTALIYIRKSVVRYEQDRASPERQLDNCMRVCEEKAWSLEVCQDHVRFVSALLPVGRW